MKRFISLILVVVMIMSVMSVAPFSVGAAQTDVQTTSYYTRGDYEYRVLEDGTAEITDYTGTETELTIPADIGGYMVTRIGYAAFWDCDSLTSVTIPDSVTSIGHDAFRLCDSLTSFTFGNSVESIDDFAFSNCDGLTSVTIPDSVTSIGADAFYDCDSLASVTIGNSVESIGEYAFYDCDKLNNVYITDLAAWCSIDFENFYSNPLMHAPYLLLNNKVVTELVVPDSVTSIGDYAFAYYDVLASVTIGNSVESIGDGAFSYCDGLASVTIPDSVTSIGESAFEDCDGLTSVTIGNSVESVGDYAFSYCDGLASVTIGNSVESIGERAFYDCDGLTSVTIGNSVESIGDFAFYSCGKLNNVYITDLAAWCSIDFESSYSNPLYYAPYLLLNNKVVTELVIPDSVTSIGDYAFAYYDVLASVTIPDSVTSIGADAFYDCDGLTSLTIGNSVESVGADAFSDCDSLASVTIGNSVESIGKYAFSDCDKLNNVYITDLAAWCNIEFGNAEANPFYYAYHLYINNVLASKIIIPNSVTKINDYAFYGCDFPKSVSISDSVTSIGTYAFYNCTGLTSATIGNSVKSIGKKAFYDCDSLASVTIGNSVESIGEYAFYDCDSLTELNTGDSVDSVTSIGDYAFSDCDSLASVTIGNSVESIGEYAFYDCDSLTELNTGDSVDSVTSIGDYAFSDCDSLKSVTIGSSVKSIGEEAFSDCYRLTELNTGNSVESIGDYAFYDCYSLKSVTIGSSVKSIGEEAFSDCTSLSKVTILDSVEWVGDDAFYNTPWYENQPDGVFYIGKVLYEYIGNMSYFTTIEIKDGTVHINDYVFSGCEALASITIPDTVTSIGYNAFASCENLSDVCISSMEAWCGIKFGNASANPLCNADFFYVNNQLVTHLVIPETVTSISGYAFNYYEGLTRVTIPETVTSIGSNAFDGCYKLTRVYTDSMEAWCNIEFANSYSNPLYYAPYLLINNKVVTDIVIPETVTSIGNYAFYGYSGLTSVTILDSVTNIGKYAFYSCESLTAITIPETVTSIGDYAFRYCDALKNITILNSDCTISSKVYIPESTTIYGYDNSTAQAYAEEYGNKFVSLGEDIRKVYKYNLLTDGNIEIIDYTGTSTQIEIPKNIGGYKVVRIGKNAFKSHTNLISVTIPDSVDCIDSFAFKGCTALKEVIIPESVTIIHVCAFEGCTSLGSVTIPDSVYDIDDSAFEDCTALTEVNGCDSVRYVGENAFNNTPWYNKLTDGVIYIGEVLYSYKGTMPAETEVVVKDGTVSITGNAFSGCEGLVGVTVPATVTYIGGDAFADTTWYNNQPDGIIYINKVLYGYKGTMPSDTEVAVKDGTLTISGNAFYGCEGLSKITIPDTVTTIGHSAFEGCTSLTEAAIPETITVISYDMFRSCTSLKKVTLPDSTKTIGENVFNGCISLSRIDIPNNVQQIYDSTFKDCTALTMVTLPDHVNRIGTSAFYGCTALDKLVILNPTCLISSSKSIPDTITIYGYLNSTAQAYAQEYGNQFVDLGETELPTEPETEPTEPETEEPTQSRPAQVKNVTFIPTANSVKLSWDLVVGCIKYWVYKYDGATGEYVIVTSAVTNSATVNNLSPETTYKFKVIGKFSDNTVMSLDKADVCVATTAALPTQTPTVEPTEAPTQAPTVEPTEPETEAPTQEPTQAPDDSGTCGTDVTWAYYESEGKLVISGAGIMNDFTYPNYAPWYSYVQMIKTVTIEEGLISTGHYAFMDCVNLTSVEIPETVISIGEDTFRNCTGLTSITLPDSVTSIGRAAFWQCTSLVSVVLGDYVTSIGRDAFYGCTSLASINIPDSVTTVNGGAFEGTIWYENQPDGFVYIGKVLYKYKGDMPENTEMVVKDGTTFISSSAFYNCTGLKSVTIPDSVTGIDMSVFNSCTSLETCVIGNSVTSISDYAFNNCTSLTSITIPDSVTYLGFRTFTGCNNLSKIIILNPDCSIASVDTIPITTTIYGYPGSTTQQCAEQFGRTFVSLDETETEPTEPVENDLFVKIGGEIYQVEQGKTYNYTAYLTVPDVKIGCIGATTYYDTEGIDLKLPVDSYDDIDKVAMFPILLTPMINTNIDGAILFNYLNTNGVRFADADSVLVTIPFTITAQSGVYEMNTIISELADTDSNVIIEDNEVFSDFALKQVIDAEVYVPETEPETEAPTQTPTVETEAPTEATEPTEAPRANKVENVVVTSTTANTVELSWDQCEDCFKYWVYKLDETTGEWVVQGRSGTTNAVVKNLAPNTTYKFKVTGKFASDNAILSLDDADVYEATTGAPAAPSEITTIMDLDKITVEWEAVEGATKYWLYKATSPEGPYYINGSSLTNSIVVKKLAPDTTYYFKVTSLTYQNGVACFSAVEDSPMLTVTTQNSDDIATKLISYTADTITINYPTVDSGYKYWIKYSTTTSDLTDTAAWTTAASSTDNSQNTYTIRKLTADTRYFVTVRVAYVDTTGANRDYDFTPITVRTPYSDSEFLTFADHPQNANYFTVTWPEDVKDVSKAWVYAYTEDGTERSLGSTTTNTISVKKFDGYENCTYVIKVLNTDGTYGEITPQGGEVYHAD